MVVEGVIIYDMHDVNTVCPLMPEVVDEELPFLYILSQWAGILLFPGDLGGWALPYHTTQTGYMRGLSGIYEEVKAFLSRYETPSRILIWRIVTRSPFYNMGCGRFKTRPHTQHSWKGDMGYLFSRVGIGSCTIPGYQYLSLWLCRESQTYRFPL